MSAGYQQKPTAPVLDGIAYVAPGFCCYPPLPSRCNPGDTSRNVDLLELRIKTLLYTAMMGAGLIVRLQSHHR